MPRWMPCKRRVFIQKLHALGFSGPLSGTRHEFMIYENCRLSIPSNLEYSVPQLKMMIREVEIILNHVIQIEEWENL